LFDLLTPEEESVDIMTKEHRFDTGLLATRLVDVTDWLMHQPGMGAITLGYFGASTGAAAALIAASQVPQHIGAVVSRGGRPDLAGPALPKVQAPTLLIVGGDDAHVIDLNREAMRQLCCENRLDIVPGATHLFEEPGALEQVAQLARAWFQSHLTRRRKEDAA
jgi:dienelactone hydrolase